MAPTAAVEVLLELPPLHLKMEAEAEAGINRLNCNEQWKPRSMWNGEVSLGHDKRTHLTNGD
jgi:hypothetical protein